MTRINTNVSSLTAQKSLAKSNSQLQTALTRLSTGLRINSGKDDPAGLIASEMLRSDIISTNKAISNTERANQMIATADSGLAQISSLLNDIRGLVTEAANSGAMSADQIAANQTQVDSSLKAIDRIAGTTAFQGKKLLDGSLGFIKTDGAGMSSVTDLEIQEANLGTSGSMTVSADITSAATQATITGTVATGAVAASAVSDFATNDITITADATGAAWNGATVDFVLNTTSLTAGQALASYNSTSKVLTINVNNSGAVVLTATIDTALAGTGFSATGGPLASNDAMAADATTAGGTDGGLAAAVNFTLTGPKGSQVYNFGIGTTISTIETAIDSNTDATGVSAGVSGTTLTLTSSEYGSDKAIKIVVNSGTTFFADDYDEGSDIVATVNGTAASGKGNIISLSTSTLAMKATVTGGSTTDFAFTITGGGALFQLGPDVVTTQQTRIGIDAMNTGSLGGSTGKLYQIADGQSDDLNSDATTAATIVDEAATKVTNLRGRIGALQKTTFETNIDALGDTVEALTEAESTIRDTDFAAETANLTRAQILVQSGTAVLQIANKSPQNVLSLLQG